MQPLESFQTPTLCTGKYTQIGYATLENNLLVGEETIKIRTLIFIWKMSYSRGSAILQPFMKLLVRPLQKKFLTDHINAAKQLVLNS
jgi:hypothetical protein